ncbi:hypothetical protein FTO74_14250 [Granulicella sp. WH15]|uniref:hypothetical protein n=1 Tax=Granulicella sp. WH15 TaxID=2602070 RepID=UPI0013671117|nr:hypothetical protein [Granulicella sp. WH15]QHN04393.1 hypothetical protein FTO74_14250 [Granulicella sp. WH15]
MNTATQIRERGGVIGPDSILCVVMDEHNVHCLNESQLDAWWANQTPEQKAAIYEADLESDTTVQAFGTTLGVCRHCGCTDESACPDGCEWVDVAHTVCSNDDCIADHLRELANDLGPIPLLRGSMDEIRAAAEEEPIPAGILRQAVSMLADFQRLIRKSLQQPDAVLQSRRDLATKPLASPLNGKDYTLPMSSPEVLDAAL